jgi:hypothetical protein
VQVDSQRMADQKAQRMAQEESQRDLNSGQANSEDVEVQLSDVYTKGARRTADR